MTCVFDVWRLLPQRCALHVPTATVVFADVHLGYSAARQHLGDAIPYRSVREEMQPLFDAVRSYDIRAAIVAGDLFEKGFDFLLYQQFVAVLQDLGVILQGVVPGNHDRGIEGFPQAKVFPAGYNLEGWHIVHGDQPIESPQAVSGHWHPALRWRGRKAPCFLVKKSHLILPAFSQDSAGVDVDRDARWHEYERFAIVGTEVIPTK